MIRYIYTCSSTEYIGTQQCPSPQFNVPGPTIQCAQPTIQCALAHNSMCPAHNSMCPGPQFNVPWPTIQCAQPTIQCALAHNSMCPGPQFNVVLTFSLAARSSSLDSISITSSCLTESFSCLFSSWRRAISQEVGWEEYICNV